VKLFLLPFFLLLAFQSKAINDTLTRAQVYNFNVGDTFDYKNENIGQNGYPYIDLDQISYYRTVITAKFYSQNQDTLFYARKVLGFPSNYLHYDSITKDTLVIVDLQMPAIFYDYVTYYYVHDTTSRLIDSIINVETFNSRIVNKAFISAFENGETAVYAEGLGAIYINQGGGDGAGDFQNDITTLIYYSQAGETWGTPASIAVGIKNVTEQQPTITLFPTINTGQFKIKIANGNSANYQLTVYDLTGREVERATLTNGVSNIEMNNPAKGMYLWSVVSEGAVLQAGKLVIQ
jgi:hypothetical protein